jgi:hypothetical protein
MADIRINAEQKSAFLALHRDWTRRLPPGPGQIGSWITMLVEGEHIRVGERTEITYHQIDPDFPNFLQARKFYVVVL